MRLTAIDLRLPDREAFDLLPVRDERLLAARDWDMAFYSVLDEGCLEDSIVRIGHRSGAPVGDGWQVERVLLDAGPETGRSQDGQALAWHDGWVYVIGSHFGKQAGPLQARRQVMARFREADAARGLAQLQVSRNGFRLHRALNDALAAADLPLVTSHRVSSTFCQTALDRAHANGKKRAARLAADDWPLRIAAAAFSRRGSLWLGLRYPVCEDGSPVLAELLNPGPMCLDSKATPQIGRTVNVAGTGSPDHLLGLRSLHAAPDGTLHAILGSADTAGTGSVILDAHPEAAHTQNSHWTFDPDHRAPVARRVGVLPGACGVDGVSLTPAGEVLYVIEDDGNVKLRHAADPSAPALTPALSRAAAADPAVAQLIGDVTRAARGTFT